MGRNAESVETIFMDLKSVKTANFIDDVLLVIQIVLNSINIFAISSWCVWNKLIQQ